MRSMIAAAVLAALFLAAPAAAGSRRCSQPARLAIDVSGSCRTNIGEPRCREIIEAALGSMRCRDDVRMGAFASSFRELPGLQVRELLAGAVDRLRFDGRSTSLRQVVPFLFDGPGTVVVVSDLVSAPAEQLPLPSKPAQPYRVRLLLLGIESRLQTTWLDYLAQVCRLGYDVDVRVFTSNNRSDPRAWIDKALSEFDRQEEQIRTPLQETMEGFRQVAKPVNSCRFQALPLNVVTLR